MLAGMHMEATILPATGSYHWPICLSLDNPNKSKIKPFQFEKFWFSHPDFLPNIKLWWEESKHIKGSMMFHFQQRLKILKNKIKIWNKTVFGNIFQALKLLNSQMETVQHQIILQGRSPELAHQEKILADQIEERQKQEEILWKKKSRIQWLKEGVHNSKFFHRSMIQSRHSNRISHMISSQGNKLTSYADMEQELISFFQNLLTEPQPDRTAAITKITQNIPCLISEDQNSLLLRTISLEEVEEAKFLNRK
jgi:hypothetical protein